MYLGELEFAYDGVHKRRLVQLRVSLLALEDPFLWQFPFLCRNDSI